jgi:ketosteroid isomerase-like protein
LSLEAELLATSDAWDATLVTNDAPAIAAFMADEWVFVDPNGITRKADLIGWIANGRLAHHSMRVVGAPRIVVHGTTAIMTARKASSGTWDGAAYTADEWITEAYVLQDGRWRCVLSHKSPVE